jgi:hypothetical protein
MTIHNRLVTAFAAVAALATVAPAQAQDHLIARVPFEFAVGNASLPRDTYRVSRMNGHPDMVFVRSDRRGALIRTDGVSLPRDGSTPSLMFHRYGDQYFLRQIRWDETGRLDLPETKAERNAAERRSDRAAVRMETVIVSAGQR